MHSTRKLSSQRAAAQTTPPAMPKVAPSAKPLRRPWRFMNVPEGSVASAEPIT